MKKLIILLLIAICLLQSGGMVLIYQLRINALKIVAESILKLEGANLEKLVLPIETYQKSKVENDEISYQGKMYDIKSISVIGNYVELVAYHDKPEEELLHELFKLFTSDKKKKPTLPDLVQKLITSIFLIPDLKNEVCIFVANQVIYRNFNENAIGQVATIFSPPPEKV